MNEGPQLTWRLALMGLVAVLVQITGVSQIPVFGVSADISPLVVASVGLLGGSLAGAAMGFWVGLLVDTALLQTLGVSSLVLLAIGYGAGRLRELRDPAHALTPLAVGAAATAAGAVGFSMMQFMLGVDSPVSPRLILDIFELVVVNAFLALPVYAIVRRVLLPFLPDDPRRRRRRAYMTGGLSPISRG